MIVIFPPGEPPCLGAFLEAGQLWQTNLSTWRKSSKRKECRPLQLAGSFIFSHTKKRPQPVEWLRPQGHVLSYLMCAERHQSARQNNPTAQNPLPVIVAYFRSTNGLIRVYTRSDRRGVERRRVCAPCSYRTGIDDAAPCGPGHNPTAITRLASDWQGNLM